MEKQINTILATLRSSGIQAAFPLGGVESFGKQEPSPPSLLIWKYLSSQARQDTGRQCEGTESAAFFLRDLDICLGADDMRI